MANRDVVLNKVSTIERCLKRVEEVYAGNPEHLKDYTKQDSIILNIQRACEASIDLAMHIVSLKQLGLPKTSRDAFLYLKEANIIDGDLTKKMNNMVGFRNIAVHDYQAINLDILQAVIENHLSDFLDYSKVILTIK
ncbi:type VII toxin-antitoxin system HepT family RNase toxin [Aquibacillus albus]|uniref:Uncharacterized protein YutE (UPF0331/DUF86 family) n=1 Tax=Aquibacillus albus TaxID=1168171 RepID=A0ABS2N0P1_9BACI|nr:DUF86 domain-containing protein [Aquibacillus albus]MBM7571715.1 uncharacterized protein YutE (UPF0331/DUF86 family) [Aquibacillus albus]